MKQDLRKNLKNYIEYTKKIEYFKPVKFYPEYEISNKGTLRNKVTNQLVPVEIDKVFNVEIYPLARNTEIVYKSLEQLQSVFSKNEIVIYKRL